MPRYWVSRIDKKNIAFFRDELDQGRLRQGWGYKEDQNLRNMTLDRDTLRNKRMFEEVKREDMVLIPHLPDSGQVTIVRATEDWDSGYKFDIPEETKDYGHCFPARKICTFNQNAKVVSAGIRSTLRCPLRFWNKDDLEQDIKKICDATEEQRNKDISHDVRLANAIDRSFNSIREKLGNSLSQEINSAFQAAEWEHVLKEVLQWRYPRGSVEHVGGRDENKHGTDLKVTIPGLIDNQGFVIAVQVKDYDHQVDFKSLMDQVSKMDYWQDQEGQRVIDKVVVFTKATREQQRELPSREDVTFVFADDLKELIWQYAFGRIR